MLVLTSILDRYSEMLIETPSKDAITDVILLTLEWNVYSMCIWSKIDGPHNRYDSLKQSEKEQE